MAIDVERQKRDNKPIDKAVPEVQPVGTRHIQVLLDRSGSMADLKLSMEEAYGSFLNEQRAIPGAEAIKYVLSTFDSPTGIEDVDTGTLLSAKPLTLIPRGGTPLYNSVVETIKRAAKRMEKDDVMLFVIITDGQNTDGGATLDDARALIAEKMNDGWAFVYLGANQDAWAVGGGMGLAKGYNSTYIPDLQGVTSVLDAASATVTQYRNYKGSRGVMGQSLSVNNMDERVAKPAPTKDEQDEPKEPTK